MTLTINGKEFKQTSDSKGLVRKFTDVSDNEVKDYFAKITEKPLPTPTPVPNKGIVYSVSTPDGSFNLRDFASSEKESGRVWTIDLPKKATKTSRNPEIKFVRGIK